MLVDSPRLSDRDREAWRRLEGYYDHRLASSSGLAVLESEAVTAIRRFCEQAEAASVSTSWGKDSTVVAHLASLTGLRIPIRALRVRHWEPPETDWVRDAFLAAHPGVDYDEVVYDDPNPKRGEPGFEAWFADESHQHNNILGRLGPAPIHGVRAQESKMRAASLRWHGVATRRVCRPIIKWSAVDVFAYLYRESLPVHPTYAMSYGGRLDRQWLRVGILGSEPPAGVRRDVAQWEDDYYGDVLASAVAQRAAQREASGSSSELLR